jgi:hypothetical protein
MRSPVEWGSLVKFRKMDEGKRKRGKHVMKRRTLVSGLGLVGMTETIARSTSSMLVSSIRHALTLLNEASDLAS